MHLPAWKTALCLIGLSLLLAACTASSEATSVPLPGEPSLGTGTAQASETPPGGSTPTAASGDALPSPTATRTLVPRPLDVDWQDVPIVPEVSQHVLDIFLDGQRQGRDATHFSVIGDCQSLPYRFMGPFYLGELEPDNSEAQLWEAIHFFHGSLIHWSVTSRGGFTAASILNPIQADPSVCKPGETPLTCEFRLNNPAYVFITLETWADPATVERYELYLRAILDYVLERGTVPILVNKADAAEVGSGMHVINPILVKLAYEYDVPIVNFWRAAQHLENGGIDATRDGFHLSEEGYNVRNILALRTLYAVWQAVGGEASAIPQEPAGRNGAPTPGPADPGAPQVTIPDCAGTCVFFATAASRDGLVASQGVHAYNLSTQTLTTVLGEGYDLQDVSQDGQRLLVNNTSHLYEVSLVDGSARLISATFSWMGEQGAYWNSDDSAVVYLDANAPLQVEAGRAYRLFPSSRDGEIYFEAGTCESKDFCQSAGVYRLNPDATVSSMEAHSGLAFSPDGSWMAFLDPQAATPDNYHHIGYLLLEEPDRGIASRRVIHFAQETCFFCFPDVRYYDYSPDGSQLFIIYDVYSAYFEKSLKLQTYLFDFDTNILYDLGAVFGISASLDPHLVWAPDGTSAYFFLTSLTPDNRYSISIQRTDLLSGERLVPFEADILVSEEYFYITNIYLRTSN
jgi:hypothetical protein